MDVVNEDIKLVGFQHPTLSCLCMRSQKNKLRACEKGFQRTSVLHCFLHLILMAFKAAACGSAGLVCYRWSSLSISVSWSLFAVWEVLWVSQINYRIM